MLKAQVIDKIQELIPDAPGDWVEQIASKMGKSTESVYAYARGDRGARKGYHKTVLRHLKELVAEEMKQTKKLLA